MEIHLEVRSVTKRFARVLAVDRLSLAVGRGTLFGLLGPNGAGKTTTIRMVMRIALPDEGQVLLGGVPLDDETRERIGYLPEERGLYRRMKVWEQLAFLGEVRGLSRSEAKRRSLDWLERLELASKANAKIEELSKGMQQKVQFAGAVIHEPELVILDEPFAGLDPIATRQMKDEMLAMRERGTTVVFSTHVLPQAEELCDHLCLINRGREILAGSMEELRERFGRPALRVVSEASDEDLARAPGVASVRADNGARILELAAGSTIPAVIRDLSSRFEVAGAQQYLPSLEDIFLRAVGEDHGAAA